MFCPYCGTAKNGYPFCGACGRADNTYVATPPVKTPLTKKEFFANANDPSTRKSLTGLRVSFGVSTVVLSLLSALIIFCVVYYGYVNASLRNAAQTSDSEVVAGMAASFSVMMASAQAIFLIYLFCTLLSIALSIVTVTTKSTVWASFATAWFVLTQGLIMVGALINGTEGGSIILVLGLLLSFIAHVLMIVFCSFLQSNYKRSQE